MVSLALLIAHLFWFDTVLSLLSPCLRRRNTQTSNGALSSDNVVVKPITVYLKAGVTNGPSPGITISQDEAVGAKTAFANWFHQNSVNQYNGSEGFDYAETARELNTTTTNMTEAVPDSFLLNCRVIFVEHRPLLDAHNESVGTSKDHASAATVPSSREVATTASQSYSILTFIPGYFNPAMPTDSRFQNTDQVRLTMRYRLGSGKQSGGDLSMTAFASTPVMAHSGQLSNFTDVAFVVPPPTSPQRPCCVTTELTLRWDLGPPIGRENEALRKPTPEEQDQFFGCVQSWMIFVFADSLSTFQALDSVMGIQYNATAVMFPHTVTVQSNVQFANATTAPPVTELTGVLRKEGLARFYSDYLQPMGGILADARVVKWEAIGNV